MNWQRFAFSRRRPCVGENFVSKILINFDVFEVPES